MKKLMFLFPCFLFCIANYANLPKATTRDYYVIQIFHCSSSNQVATIDSYLKNTMLPYLHKTGIAKVGVFAPIDNDTAIDKRLFVWIPLSSINELEALEQKIEQLDPMGSDPLIHLENTDSTLPYNRFEKIITRAFKLQPNFVTKSNLSKLSSRIYEYRSYESPTENTLLRKIHMFNEGGEIEMFDRLNFNPIFYSKVIAGSRMPNLIYMTSFNNMDERNERWKAFFNDPVWKKIAVDPAYLKSVNKSETVLMSARDYADF
jgi:hypothetical protein